MLECLSASGIRAAMSEIMPVDEATMEAAIADFVMQRLPLGVYDPMQPHRVRTEVVSFQVELLEPDLEDGIVHAAGPVVLRTPHGDVENFLRLSVQIRLDGGEVVIPDGGAIRASYIVETDHPQGACKETAALANA